jgi:hypothetical protein
MARRYPKGAPEPVVNTVEHELKLIEELAYEPFFLTVQDIVNFARSKKILCQGRGSAANSSVCYCLGITEVDPGRMSVLFERFISKERNEPPDIDVDFEHQRREEVIQYIYESTDASGPPSLQWSSPTSRGARCATWARPWACPSTRSTCSPSRCRGGTAARISRSASPTAGFDPRQPRDP